MPLTKNNGTKIKKSSKKQKIVHEYPNLKLGQYKKDRHDKVTYNNLIIYQDSNGIFTKDVITNIVSHPRNTFKKLKYLIKNVVVNTKNGVTLKIISVKDGIIRGVTFKNT